MKRRTLCSRTLSLILSLFIILSSSVITSFAASTVSDASGKCGEKLFWYFDSSARTLFIYGEGKMENYKHYSATAGRAPWVDFRASIRTLVIDEGCTEIGEYAFIGAGIQRIYFPESSLKKIHTMAFYLNYQLESIEIPDGVTYIGKSAFGQCLYTTYLKVGSGLTEIGMSAFSDMPRLVTVELSEDVKVIGASAFYQCYELKNINLSHVEEIAANAFFNCTALTEVSLGDNLKNIGSQAFGNCSSLAEINFSPLARPEKFASGFAYNSLYENNLQEGPYTLFGGTVLCNKGKYQGDSLVIPDGVEIISDYCFSSAYYITTLEIPASVRVIGDYSFFNNRSLLDVYIPDTVQTIGSNNFGYMQENSYNYFTDTVKIHGKYGTAASNYAMENKLCFVCEHEFHDISTVSDCAEGGFVYSICDCGYINTKTSVLPTEHRTETKTIPAGCTSDGSITVKCIDCGVILSETILPAEGHKPSSAYTVSLMPTCESGGYLSLICKKCGEETERREIEAKGHSSNLTSEICEPTCTSDGYAIEICPDCGKEVSSTILPKTSHTSDSEWTIITSPAPDSSIPGAAVKFCTECNAVSEFMWFVGEGDALSPSESKLAAANAYSELSSILSGSNKAKTYSASVDFNSDGKISSKDKLTLKKLLSAEI